MGIVKVLLIIILIAVCSMFIIGYASDFKKDCNGKRDKATGIMTSLAIVITVVAGILGIVLINMLI